MDLSLFEYYERSSEQKLRRIDVVTKALSLRSYFELTAQPKSDAHNVATRMLSVFSSLLFDDGRNTYVQDTATLFL